MFPVVLFMVFGPFLDAFSKADEPGFPIFKPTTEPTAVTRSHARHPARAIPPRSTPTARPR